MKKFSIKVISYFLAVVLISFIPCMVVDPYNVFHPLNMRSNGFEPNKNYIKTYYILKNPDKFSAFILGSSHVAIVNPEKISDDCYNMYYSGASADENLKTLQTLLDNGIVPSHIYMGLDNISYVDCYDVHISQRLRAPYQYSQTDPLDFWMLYLDPVVNLLAVKQGIQQRGMDLFTPIGNGFYENGGAIVYGERDELNQETENVKISQSYREMIEYLNDTDEYPEDNGYMDITLDAVAKVRKLCEDNGIELTVFVNPIYYKQFAKAVTEKAYLSFMRRLADITTYYNFSGYNKFTTDCRYYYSDEEHYSSDLGDLMINSFTGGKTDPEAMEQGFGVLVNADNIEEVILKITDPDADW